MSKALLINRHDLHWSYGPGAQYVPAATSNRTLMTRTFGDGLNTWSGVSFPDTVVCDMNNHERVHRIAQWLIDSRGVDRVVALHEKDMLLAGRLRDANRLAGMSYTQTMPYRDKLAMKDRLRASGYSSLPSYICGVDFNTYSDLPWAGKAIVKSRWGLGSSAIFVASDDASIALAIGQLGLPLEDVNIEEYIDYPMFHCDSVMSEGRIAFTSVSEYLQTPASFKTESWGGSVIVREGEQYKQLIEHNQRVLSSLGVHDAVTHAEFFATPEGPVLCEVAARPGGGDVGKLVWEAHRVNLIEASVRMQCGQPPRLPSSPHSNAIVGFLMIYHDVATNDLRETLSIMPGVVAFKETPKAWNGPSRHSTDCAYRILLCADRRIDFDVLVGRVVSCISESNVGK